MRIHGDKTIRRRCGLEQRQYPEYENELREDFHYLCGYCGKSEEVSKKGFEPDHFVPQKIAPEQKNDYSNLVYSCFICNRKKGGKWPTNNSKRANDGVIGFVDPATKEYDLHLSRDASGKIISNTPVGEYMKNVFQFDKRPIELIWKAMKIKELKNKLRKKWDKLSSVEKDEYAKIDIELDSLLQYIFEKKE